MLDGAIHHERIAKDFENQKEEFAKYAYEDYIWDVCGGMGT